jgi:DNA polymerase sigma
MNEVYTGGIGSFSLVNMIVTSLQLHASRRREEQQQRRPKKRAKHRQQQQQQQQGKEEEGEVAQEEVHLDGNLGVLLMDFFRWVLEGGGGPLCLIELLPSQAGLLQLEMQQHAMTSPWHAI